jgi:hypothetical protein
MTRAWTAYLMVAGLLVVACNTQQQQAETETAATAQAEALPPEVARAVAVSRGIDANPAAADSVLAANGLTRAGLDSLMYTIAADSALSAAYTRATQ